jgi:hypothetical protein
MYLYGPSAGFYNLNARYKQYSFLHRAGTTLKTVRAESQHTMAILYSNAMPLDHATYRTYATFVTGMYRTQSPS